jgi:hypothetical protein
MSSLIPSVFSSGALGRPRSAGLRCGAAVRCCAVFVLLFGSACPQHVKEESSKEQFTPCTSLGQRCEFSPGKLGSCVQIDNCKSGSCFVCQSQH